MFSLRGTLRLSIGTRYTIHGRLILLDAISFHVEAFGCASVFGKLAMLHMVVAIAAARLF